MTQYREYKFTVYLEHQIIKRFTAHDSDVAQRIYLELEKRIGKPGTFGFHGSGRSQMLNTERIIGVECEPELDIS